MRPRNPRQHRSYMEVVVVCFGFALVAIQSNPFSLAITRGDQLRTLQRIAKRRLCPHIVLTRRRLAQLARGRFAWLFQSRAMKQALLFPHRHPFSAFCLLEQGRLRHQRYRRQSGRQVRAQAHNLAKRCRLPVRGAVPIGADQHSKAPVFRDCNSSISSRFGGGSAVSAAISIA